MDKKLEGKWAELTGLTKKELLAMREFADWKLKNDYQEQWAGKIAFIDKGLAALEQEKEN